MSVAAGRVIKDVPIQVDINSGNVIYEVTAGKSTGCVLGTRLKTRLEWSSTNANYIVRKMIDAGWKEVTVEASWVEVMVEAG